MRITPEKQFLAIIGRRSTLDEAGDSGDCLGVKFEYSLLLVIVTAMLLAKATFMIVSPHVTEVKAAVAATPPVLPGPQRAASAEVRVRPALEAALEEQGLKFGAPVFVRAFKEEMVLEVFVRDLATKKFRLFRTYPISRSSGVLGPKLLEGDGQVPEGFYFVPPAAMKPDSQFHLAFNIGYPNAYDQFHRRTGNSIMVHGNAVSAGCLAMTDVKIEEIYTLCAAALRSGQAFFRVQIFPFRMTDERLAKAAGDRWEPFWRNLKQGYDFFETHGFPPDATVENGTYQFRDDAGGETSGL
jgi:murein L,D-transpeptidase YafK